MTRSPIRRMTAIASAIAIALLAAGTATASAPVSESWTSNVDRPYLYCPTFTVNGVWAISHTLTFFFDNNGVAIRDTELIDFRGSFVNATTGASVQDSGRILFFDTLAPDGSYLTTVANQVRHSKYMHGAGRIDFQREVYHGTDGENAAGVAALCAALGE